MKWFMIVAILAMAVTAWADDVPVGPVAAVVNSDGVLAGVAWLAVTLWGIVSSWLSGSRVMAGAAAGRYSKAMQALEAGVELTYRTYVRSIKESREDGKLTQEEMRLARRRAREAAVEFGRTKGIDVLKELGAEYIDLLIAKLVKGMKGVPVAPVRPRAS